MRQNKDKTNKNKDRITKVQQEELLEKERKGGNKHFLRNIAGTSGTGRQCHLNYINCPCFMVDYFIIYKNYKTLNVGV